MMQYKGYIGKVEFDDEAGIFHGEVINTRDVVTFQGETVTELERRSRSPFDIISPFASCAARPPTNLSPASS